MLKIYKDAWQDALAKCALLGGEESSDGQIIVLWRWKWAYRTGLAKTAAFVTFSPWQILECVPFPSIYVIRSEFSITFVIGLLLNSCQVDLAKVLNTYEYFVPLSQCSWLCFIGLEHKMEANSQVNSITELLLLSPKVLGLLRGLYRWWACELWSDLKLCEMQAAQLQDRSSESLLWLQHVWLTCTSYWNPLAVLRSLIADVQLQVREALTTGPRHAIELAREVRKLHQLWTTIQ